MTSPERKVDITEHVGQMLIGGWGVRVAIGYLFGLLKPVTPEIVYSYITESRPLFIEVPGEEWEKWRSLAKTAKLNDITTERVIAEFRKRRPDLLQVIINSPSGMTWVETQVSELHQKLSSP